MNHYFVDRRCPGDENANLKNGDSSTTASIVKGFKALFADVETAPYTVTRQREGFEERHYPPRLWAITTKEGTDRESVATDMYRTLFTYISGKNRQNLRMAVTSPVATHVTPGPTYNTYTMGFLIPEEHQDSPPQSGAEVRVERRPALTVLTRRFGGYATEQAVTKELKELTELLQSAGEHCVDYSRYYVVTYDSPIKLIGRRNEIWFVKSKHQSNGHHEQPVEDGLGEDVPVEGTSEQEQQQSTCLQQSEEASSTSTDRSTL